MPNYHIFIFIFNKFVQKKLYLIKKKVILHRLLVVFMDSNKSIYFNIGPLSGMCHSCVKRLRGRGTFY